MEASGMGMELLAALRMIDVENAGRRACHF